MHYMYVIFSLAICLVYERTLDENEASKEMTAY